MSAEENLQNYQKERLQQVYNHYGSDKSRWEWLVNARFRCRAERAEGILATDLKADLALGKRVCPIKGKVCNNQQVPHPAGNVAGYVLANNFSEKCPLCGFAPISTDFDINVE